VIASGGDGAAARRSVALSIVAVFAEDTLFRGIISPAVRAKMTRGWIICLVPKAHNLVVINSSFKYMLSVCVGS
jgi:hypothetical protein